jgi:dienelactone hydrolase
MISVETVLTTRVGTETETEASAASEPTAPKVRRRPTRARVVLFLLALVATLVARPASHHARAASLLRTFSEAETKPAAQEERFTFSSGGEQVRARIYWPAEGHGAPGLVLVHGVHHAGIDEPRLERFARGLASAGIVVMTPAVRELSDYEVAPRSIDTIGAASEELRRQIAKDKVGLVGTSFGGGLALLTAADPRFADHIGYVVAVGAHDDMARVSRFFVTDEAPVPNGPPQKIHAHGYGMMVLVYSHAGDFFPPEDVPAAREALRLWLWEKRGEAKDAAGKLSPASKAKIDRLFSDEPDDAHALAPELLAEIESHRADMAAVSPHGRLGGLRADVFLLHGAGDNVIPKAETLWLAEDVPAAHLRSTLVSPAIQHVELKSPTFLDEVALVHFMGDVIAEAESTR